MAYSIEFRKRAIEYIDAGHTGKELYKAFKIYPSTIGRWRKLFDETGSLEPQYNETRKGKIDLSELQKAVEERPDAYLSELAVQFDCTKQAIFYALKRLKITLKKKTFTYSEKCEVSRYLYILMLIIYIFILNVTNIIFVDESGINAYYQREYGRAKRGTKVQDTKRGKRFRRTNVIAGLWGKKHIAVHCYEHTTTAAFFEDWFEFELLALIPEGSLVIMDNASFHIKKHLFEIASRYGINLLFLPTYSPDYNPIEKSWANFKKWLCDNLKRFPSVQWAAEAYFCSNSY